VTEEEVRRMLQAYIGSGHGSLTNAAERMRVPVSDLCEIRSGKRHIPEKVLQALGVKRVVVYVKK
jgi:hypothetical protein